MTRAGSRTQRRRFPCAGRGRRRAEQTREPSGGMAGSALTPAVRRKAPARTERCLLLEAVPWQSPTYGILGGGRLEMWSRAELRTHPATERAGLEILRLRMRAPVPHPTGEVGLDVVSESRQRRTEPITEGGGSTSSSPCGRNSIRQDLDESVSQGLAPTPKRSTLHSLLLTVRTAVPPRAWSLRWAFAARRNCTGYAANGLRQRHARLTAFQTD